MGDATGAGGGGGGIPEGGIPDSEIAGATTALPAGRFDAVDNPGRPDDSYSAARAAVDAARNDPQASKRWNIGSNRNVDEVGATGLDIYTRGNPVVLVKARDGSRADNITSFRKPKVGRLAVVTKRSTNGNGYVQFAGEKKPSRIRAGQYQVFSFPINR